MISSFLSWFQSRSRRERFLLQLAAFLVIGVGGGFWAYRAATDYRAAGGTELASAMELRDDISKLKQLGVSPAGSPPPSSDGTVRGVALAVAEQYGLKPARVEPDGPTGVRAAFQPSTSRSVYLWVDAVERAGLAVTRIVVVRVGEGDAVEANATIAPRKT